MQRLNRTVHWTTVCLVLAVGVMIQYTWVAHSKVAGEDSLNRNAATGRLIVHEWGTFTSFSGSNGVQLDFRPLLDEDLPDFVFDRSHQAGADIFLKGRIRARVRMETPVTYFYTDVERSVQARVDFPQGLLTEFYPPVQSMLPDITKPQLLENSQLDWGTIDLIPPKSLMPAVTDPTTREWLHSEITKNILTREGAARNHYYHARETDSAFVHKRLENSPGQLFTYAGDYLEKYLFYRGVGKFVQPLQVVVDPANRVRMTNHGSLPIRSLFKVTVKDGSISLAELDQIAPGATAEFPQSDQPVDINAMRERITVALINERLYEKEATAMVNTWADSWFLEEGTRVFYLIPREKIDEILPLTISPAPDETVRVMVGRVEVMSPSVEERLIEVVQARSVQRATLLKSLPEEKRKDPIEMPIPVEIMKLGRLAEPALVRVRELIRDPNVSLEAEKLLSELRAAMEKAASQKTASVER